MAGRSKEGSYIGLKYCVFVTNNQKQVTSISYGMHINIIDQRLECFERLSLDGAIAKNHSVRLSVSPSDTLVSLA